MIDFLYHVLGCGIGCLVAHAIQAYFFSHRHNNETIIPTALKKISRPYTQGTKLKPKANNDQVAWARENGREI